MQDTSLFITRKRWEIYRAAAQQAQDNGQLSLSQASWLSSLEEAETLGENSPQLVTSLEGLAETYWIQRNYVMAAPLCRRLLRIYEANLGASHLNVSVIANNLAILYHFCRRYEDAERFYSLALGIKLQHLQQTHPDVSSLLTNYASLLTETGRKAEADNLKSRSF